MTWLIPIWLTLAGVAAGQSQSAEEWRRIGLAKISNGQPKLATPALERACALEKAPGDSCYFLARNHHALGDFEAARKSFDLALKAAPQSLMPRLYRAVALNYSALGRNEEAERNFRKAMESGPVERDDVRIDFGAFLFRQGRMEEASELLRHAVESNPESARANLECGRVLLQTGQLEAAAKHLKKAVDRRPSDWNGHLLLGRAYQRMGRDAEAARELALGESKWRQKQP
jgi:Tfp pilus assembly protein PilF